MRSGRAREASRSIENLSMNDAYSAGSFGAVSVGFGLRPAVLVVDFQKGFTDPSFELGKSSPCPLTRSSRPAALLRVAPRGEDSGRELPGRVGKRTTTLATGRSGALHRNWFYGDPTQEMDERIYDPRARFQLREERALDLLRHAADELSDQAMHRQRSSSPDANTSGCVRASIVVDAFSYGFRVIVPEDCCAAMSKGGPHDAKPARLRSSLLRRDALQGT